MITSGTEEAFAKGNLAMSAGDLANAESCFRDAIRLDPESSAAYANLALVLEKTGSLTRAEFYYRHSLALSPDLATVHLNLANLLASLKRFDEAEASYRKALSLEPNSAIAWSNLGVLYACMQRDQEAEQCHLKAMELDSQYAPARFNLSYLFLRRGDLGKGWDFLDARETSVTLSTYLGCPRWQGEPFAGKSILIGFEGGHGDMVQFCRYAAVLKSHGASKVAIICPPALTRLFSTVDDLDEIFSFEAHVPTSGWDFWTPVLSLPYRCHTRLDSIPVNIPYLHPPSDEVARWDSMLPREGKRVGLVWKGSKKFENDADRSLPGLATLAPLGKISGIHFIGLQKGAGEDDAKHPPEGLSLLDMAPHLGDFADTAAIIQCIDLVICVDTAVAHVAGALGKPCWILLPYYKADWRWLTERTDSPWYPGTTRLFRQSSMGNWPHVIDEVSAALMLLVNT